MKRIWVYASNVFLNVTKGSIVLAMEISTYHDSELKARLGTDPLIDAMYADYHPKHLAFKALYAKWLAKGGQQHGQTLNLEQLLNLLATKKIEQFEDLIKAVYPKGSTEFASFFPKKRKPFQKGKQISRIEAVSGLITNIGDNEDLAAAKVIIQTFYDQLDTANNDQKGSKGLTKGTSNDIELSRKVMCTGQYANLGKLMAFHAEEPTLIQQYFDLVAIRNHQQNIFKSHLNPDAQENLLVHTFSPGDTFKVTTDQNLRLFLSDNPAAFSGTMQEVLAGIAKVINVDDFGVDLSTHRYLIVLNLSGTAVAVYKVAL